MNKLQSFKSQVEKELQHKGNCPSRVANLTDCVEWCEAMEKYREHVGVFIISQGIQTWRFILADIINP